MQSYDLFWLLQENTIKKGVQHTLSWLKSTDNDSFWPENLVKSDILRTFASDKDIDRTWDSDSELESGFFFFMYRKTTNEEKTEIK